MKNVVFNILENNIWYFVNNRILYCFQLSIWIIISNRGIPNGATSWILKQI